MEDSPIVCTLTPGEMQERKASLLPGILARADRIDALAHGYRVRFAASSETLQAIAAMIRRASVLPVSALRADDRAGRRTAGARRHRPARLARLSGRGPRSLIADTLPGRPRSPVGVC
jgi:hypothetical protein